MENVIRENMPKTSSMERVKSFTVTADIKKENSVTENSTVKLDNIKIWLGKNC
jgi:hypothetical protein